MDEYRSAPVAESRAWEFGAMGLEGAMRLGFKRELEAVPEGDEREALFEHLVGELYAKGKATEAAAFLEIDAVIDPADTRRVVSAALDAASAARPPREGGGRFVDTW